MTVLAPPMSLRVVTADGGFDLVDFIVGLEFDVVSSSGPFGSWKSGWVLLF